MTSRCLGKKPPKHDRRTLLMANYLDAQQLPPIPSFQSWVKGAKSDFGMMLNSDLGDCTCAAMAHLIQAWTSACGAELTLPDSDVLAAYEAACGYSPLDPTTDQGGIELDVLNWWRSTGIGGHKIDAYVALEPHNHLHMRAGVFLFGGVYVGIALPITAQDQSVWSVVPHAPSSTSAPGSWGGHAVAVVAYDPHYLWCITWGKLQRMTWGFVDKYLDEAYAVLSPDWFTSSSSLAPSGFDLAQLQADLAAL